MFAQLLSLDRGVVFSVEALRSPFVTSVIGVITHFGDVPIILCGLVLAWFLMRKRTYATRNALLITVMGALSTTALLKYMIARPRPLDPLFGFEESTSAFPSGHATGAMALYGFLAYVIITSHLTIREKFLGALLCGVMILSVGVSRVYLGVHFPSDVIAGFLVGGVWLAIGIRASHRRMV